MATTIDSSQVNIPNNDEVEMMLVDNTVPEDDDREEIKIDDDIDDDDDELSDDDDDDVVSNTGSGSSARHTPTSILHNNDNIHNNHYYGHGETRIQQHHHHHFHYFYQYPTITVNDAQNNTSDSNTNDNTNNIGLVRTISNGSMFGPINTNLVPLLQNNRFHPFNGTNLAATSNHHLGHVYNNNNNNNNNNNLQQIDIAHQQHNSLVHRLNQHNQQHHHHHHQQQQQQQQQHQQQYQQQNHQQQNDHHSFRPKPPSPSVVITNPLSQSQSGDIDNPISPSIQSNPDSTTTLFSTNISSSSVTTNNNNNTVGVSSLNQTVISSIESVLQSTNHQSSDDNNCSSYHSFSSQQAQQTQIIKDHNELLTQQNQQTQQTHLQQQQQQQQREQNQQQKQQQQQQPLVSTVPPVSNIPTIELPYTFGRSYQLISQIEASNLYLCIDVINKQEFCCKVVNSSKYSKFLGPHMRMDGHNGINQIQKVIFEPHFTFVLFERSFGDLHSYVRNRRRLRETEAQSLFQQILQIVADCHDNGIVLRDLKLRKFIFANEEKTKLKLETLEGASIFDGDNDILTDKHGCPAYVSPEILYSNSYSGMAADCWSMGVILYTMLVGRYPFHDLNPSIVFVKIRRGTYDIPETLSKQARCLIKNLIRLEPEHRLTANDALAHRWFQDRWNFNTKERIIQQQITQLHNFQHQQFLFQHSLSDLTVGPPPRALLTPSLIEGLLQISDDQVVPTF